MRVRYEYPTEYVYECTIDGKVTTHRYMKPVDIKGTLAKWKSENPNKDYDIRLVGKYKNGCYYVAR